MSYVSWSKHDFKCVICMVHGHPTMIRNSNNHACCINWWNESMADQILPNCQPITPWLSRMQAHPACNCSLEIWYLWTKPSGRTASQSYQHFHSHKSLLIGAPVRHCPTMSSNETHISLQLRPWLTQQPFWKIRVGPLFHVCVFNFDEVMFRFSKVSKSWMTISIHLYTIETTYGSLHWFKGSFTGNL